MFTKDNNLGIRSFLHVLFIFGIFIFLNSLGPAFAGNSTNREGASADGDNNLLANPASGCVTLTSPNGGETFVAQSTIPITWTNSSAGSSVRLSYSTDEGLSWIVLAGATTNDGSFNWTVPDIETELARIKVEDRNNPDCWDMSDENFTIKKPAEPCGLSLTQPNGGEVLENGTVYEITWTSQNSSGNVQISYSTNSGSTWETVISTTEDDGLYQWTIPNITSAQCRVKVEDKAEGESCFDESDADFTITTCPLKVLSPNGGEHWDSNIKRYITWIPLGLEGDVSLAYSTDDGTSWNTIVSNTRDDGCYQWQLPNLIANNAQVKVTSLINPNCSDTSDGYFAMGACQSPYIKAADVLAKTGTPVLVDIEIKDNTNIIGAFGFRLNYDPTHLTFVEVQKGDLTTEWATVDGNKISDGIIRLGGYNTTPIETGSSGSIVKVLFNVNCADCANCDQSLIVISDLIDHISGLNICNGTFQYGMACTLGDVNMDGNITPGDALCAFQTYLNAGTPPDGCDNDCAVEAADANCSGAITPGDALLIFQAYLSEATSMECPTSLAKRDFNDRILTIADVTGLPEEKISIPVTINNIAELTSFGMTISYPQDILKYEGISPGVLTQNWYALEANTSQPGVITIGGFDPEAVKEAGPGVLFELNFVVRQEARGSGLISILEQTDDLAAAEIQSGSIKTTITGLGPDSYGLAQNHPNPFNSSTEIVYWLQDSGPIEVKIMDIVGRTVRTFWSGDKEAGTHKIVWNGQDFMGRDVPTGVYICTLRTRNEWQSIKMLLLK